MTAQEMINVITDDMKTNPKSKELEPYIELIMHVFNQYPNSEVNTSATVESLQEAMYEHAKKNQTNHAYVFSPEQSILFTKEHFGIKDTQTNLHSNAKIVNLEDFF